jgi:hypothetical protein
LLAIAGRYAGAEQVMSQKNKIVDELMRP